jgi:hypothetical protein
MGDFDMTRAACLLPLLLAVVIALPAGAQPAASPVAPEPSKQCLTATKKVAAEQRSLTGAIDSLTHDKKARESCSGKSMCERYDTAISATEKRQARHETRLARFKEDAAKACRAP